MSRESASYDIGQVDFILDGLPIDGFGDSDVINIEWNSRDWTLKVGATGAAQRSRIRDESGMVTLKLNQTSPFNKELEQRRKIDSGSGRNPFTLLIRENLGGSRFFSRTAFIEGRPSWPLGQEAGVIEWKIICPHLDADIQGGLQH